MQDGKAWLPSLRDLAAKCRQLAAQLCDEGAAASLRNLAEEYDLAADAAEQREDFHWNPPGLTPPEPTFGGRQ